MKDLLERVENNDSTIEAEVPVPTNENVSPNFSEAMLAIIEKDCMEAERDAEMGSLSDQITKEQSHKREGRAQFLPSGNNLQ